MIQKTTFWAAHVAALKLEQGETGDRKQGTDHGFANFRKTENRGLSPVLWFGD